ncbi:MAG: DNA polymerase I, partial [Candidatus Sungbacteria bacterium]|nr:DNA polymerase I [Candidatus Sungbacteria bacterium]
GEPANAVYGFAAFILRVLKELKPDYLAAAFDLPGKTFRHERYEAYKAHRPPVPDDLIIQFSRVREVLEGFNIPIFEKEGYEADDIIGTMVRRLEKGKEKECEIIIVTGDMDALQLVGPRVRVYTMRRGIADTTIYDEAAVRERFGFEPKQIIDFKGLKGDVSDNIKGVKGIGEKTAIDLIQKFGSVAGIYAALKKGTKKISPSVAEKLIVGMEDAQESRELAEMDTNVPIEFSLDDLAWRDGEEHRGAMAAVLERFGFASLVRRVNGTGAMSTTAAGVKKKSTRKGDAQLSLLDGAHAARDEGVKILDSRKAFELFMGEASGHTVGLVVDGADLVLVREGEGDIWMLDSRIAGEKPVKDFFAAREDFVVHDAKTIILFLRRLGIPLGGCGYDVMLASYILGAPERDFSYRAIVERTLGSVVTSAREAAPKIFAVAAHLREAVAGVTSEALLADVELPLARILASMEERGIVLDTPFLKKLAMRIDKELKKLTARIYELAGAEFNINSSQQLSQVLFEKLELATRGLRKTAKGGVVSTRESELEKLREKHEIVGVILDYREAMKLKTTYVDVLPKLADAVGRVHTTYNQTGTATGRLSSSNPNMQNIPTGTGLGREVRRAFITASGYSLVSFDYSQIELRVAAHLANDEKMIAAFIKGLDIHAMTASAVYGVSEERITPELRRAAKVLNFGVLYGMGPQAFAENTGMAMGEAREFISNYFREFSGVRTYIEATRLFAAEHGYVQTLLGRRRYFPEMGTGNWQARREAERMAVNHPIQGTATGDIIKLAMIRVDEWVVKTKKEESVRMLLQVHDELVFEIAEQEMAVVREIKKIMESVIKLKVPLVVDVKAGPNWGDQESILKNS